MKMNINKETVFIVLGVLLIITICIYINHLRSNVGYLDCNCPVCGSEEVGDFGEDSLNQSLGTKGHCFGCGAEFYVEK